MDPHQRKIIQAAERLGINITPLQSTLQIDAIELSYQGQKEIVTLGRVFSHLNAIADQVAANKVASKTLMKALGIPVPPEVLLDVKHLDEIVIEQFLFNHPLVVVKPLIGTDGIGIAMHLRTRENICNHIEAFAHLGHQWILEAQVKGEDLRLQYLNGEIVAACVRKPCFIVGNGQDSIQSLIDHRNELIQTQNPDNFIAVDHQVKRRLALAEFDLTTVLKKGYELQLKDVSNMAQGGHAIDISHKVHPHYLNYLDALANSLHIRVLSLDVMTDSPELDPAQHATALEFNARPAWLHHTFSEGKQHDIPTLILKDLFQIKS